MLISMIHTVMLCSFRLCDTDYRWECSTLHSLHVHAINCRAMQGHAINCRAMQGHAINCRAMQGHAINCRAMQGHAINCRAMQDHAINCRAMQGHAINCRAMQGHAINCRAMQGHAIFNTGHKYTASHNWTMAWKYVCPGFYQSHDTRHLLLQQRGL